MQVLAGGSRELRSTWVLLSIVVLAGVLAGEAGAATWAERRADFKQRLGAGWSSIKDEVGQWPGIVRELPGAYVETLASGDQLRSVAGIPRVIAAGARALGHEAAYIPDYIREVPVEYWRSLADGRQADSLAGLVKGVTDRGTFGLLRVDVGPRFGNPGAYKDGEGIGSTVVDAQVGTLVTVGVVAGASRTLTALRGAMAGEATVLKRGSSLLGVETEAAAEISVAERVAMKERAAARVAGRAAFAEEQAAAAARAAEFAGEPLAKGHVFRTKEMLLDYVGEWEGKAVAWRNGEIVKYFTDSERAAHRLFFRDGKIYDATGKLFDTSGAMTHGAGGRAIFVMDEAGNMFASNRQIVGELHHSTLAAGRPVAAAGELSVEKGVLKLVGNGSGHYRPTMRLTDQALERLRRLGVDVSQVAVDLQVGTAIY